MSEEVVRRRIPAGPATDPLAGPLGRHVHHDPRSRSYPARRSEVLVSVRHVHHEPTLDQGSIGACTGFAAVHDVGHDPCWRTLPVDVHLDETTAVRVYSRATELDDVEGIDGRYPPEDTGSSGLAACKASTEAGLMSGYRWAFGIEEALATLVEGPVMVGVNWYSSFDSPTAAGELRVTSGAYVRGGHEIVLDEIDVTRRRVWMVNSWGPLWGIGGRAWMSFDTLDRLLQEQGDVIQPVPVSEPAPVPVPAPGGGEGGILARLVRWVGRVVLAWWRAWRG